MTGVKFSNRPKATRQVLRLRTKVQLYSSISRLALLELEHLYLYKVFKVQRF